jgi:hypothetical protein
MGLAQEIDAALAAGLSPRDIMVQAHQRDVQRLHEAERGKRHVMSDFRFPAATWAGFKALLLDGGGVTDEGALHDAVLQAVHDDDQAAFWAEVPHMLKAALKRTGKIVPIPGTGAVMVSGAPTAAVTPPVAPTVSEGEKS